MGIILLLIAHLFGDFILQTTKTADKKSESRKYFIIHCGIYSFSMMLALVCFGPIKNVVIIFFVISLSHIIIDYLRIQILKTSKKTNEFTIFLADQIVHIIIILVCIQFIAGYSFLGNVIKDYLLKFVDSKQLFNILFFVLLYIICTSPAAVLIKKVFLHFSFQKDTEDLMKSGYYIGILERIIILTLGLNGEIGAIGFVIAAKSLARFKQLEDKQFAEKYLLGTLLSVMIALICITLGRYFT